MTKPTLSPLFLLVFCTGSALAQEHPPSAPLWDVGLFAVGVTQQAYPGAAERINRGLVVPTVYYRGKYLRADGDGAGIRAIKTPRFEFDVGFAAAFGSRADEVEIRRGMPELGTMVEFGPRAKWNLGRYVDGRLRAEFPLRGVFDVSDSFRQKGVSFEPRLIWERRVRDGWSYNASIAALIGDRKLNDTFYGVAPAYARADRPAYVADRGLIAVRLAAGVSHAMGKDWRVFLFTRIDDVHAAANKDSPLMQKKTGGSVGFGLSYTFLRSKAMASD